MPAFLFSFKKLLREELEKKRNQKENGGCAAVAVVMVMAENARNAEGWGTKGLTAY